MSNATISLSPAEYDWVMSRPADRKMIRGKPYLWIKGFLDRLLVLLALPLVLPLFVLIAVLRKKSNCSG